MKRAESNKNAQRVRKHREKRYGNVTVTLRGEEREEIEERRDRARPEAKPEIKTMLDVKTLLVPVGQAVELFEHWQTEHNHTHGTTKVLVAPSAGLESAKRVLTLASGDMALAKSVVTAFVRAKGQRWWTDKKHALYVLGDARDFEQARLMASETPKSKTSADAQRAAYAEQMRREEMAS
jgi:hypothetical protein